MDLRLNLIQPSLLQRDLLSIYDDHDCARKPILASLDLFGPEKYFVNTSHMARDYMHPQNGGIISFRPPTVKESITLLSVMQEHSNEFSPECDIKGKALDTHCLQLGTVVSTYEGLYINPPDSAGLDEDKLSGLLSSATEKGGFFLIGEDSCFIPKKSFCKTKDYSNDDFFQTPLAQAMSIDMRQHFKRFAVNQYPGGIFVSDTDYVPIKPTRRVLTLNSDKSRPSSKMQILYCADVYFVGYSFAVLNKGA